MSRHRFVKNMNIAEELDDDAFSDDAEDDMTQEEEALLQDAIEQVRTIVGDEESSGLPDDQVKRVVWNNYFDVGKSVGILLEEQERQAAARERKAHNSMIDKDLPAVPPDDSEPNSEEYDEEYDPAPEDFGIYPSIMRLPPQSTGNDGTSYRLYTISERTEVSRSGTWSSTHGRLPTAATGVPVSSRTNSSYGQLFERQADVAYSAPSTSTYGEVIQSTMLIDPPFISPSSTLTPLPYLAERLQFSTASEDAESDRTVTPLQSPRPSMPPMDAIPEISDSRSRSTQQPMSANSIHASTIRQIVRPALSTPEASSVAGGTSKKSKLASLASTRTTSRSDSLRTVPGSSEETSSAITYPVLRASRVPSTSSAKLAMPRSLTERKAEPPTSDDSSGLGKAKGKLMRIPKTTPLEPDSSLNSAPDRPQAPTPALAHRGRPVPSTSQLESEPISSLGPEASNSRRPASKLALLAQAKSLNVPRVKQPKVMGPPLVHTKYLTPTSNTSVMTTAITTYMQTPDTMLALSTAKLPPSYPPISQPPSISIPTSKLTKLASKAKKGRGNISTAVTPDVSMDHDQPITHVVDPIYRGGESNFRASPSAFASLLVDDVDLTQGEAHIRSDSFGRRKKRQTGGMTNGFIHQHNFSSSGTVSSEFSKPSPDDIVFDARRGTSLGEKHRHSTSQPSKPAASQKSRPILPITVVEASL